ncbi:cache domain-containing sensor histidine kinase [Cohnella caldifontis]|uniref:cache domain-containing sensor histidine kinase n=1 Tax=Cohnella caldifontis TaxID=3027471 RepID=UPI0023EC4A19|nr:sensor histidine kinase [Cohnella sp. YIM B05605]
MRLNFSKYNTLRNQMLIGYLLVMVLILSFVASVTFASVSDMLRNNAEKNIQQTAVQANGRLEGVLQQINSLSLQVATNIYVQNLLLGELNGKPASFTEKQNLPAIINTVPIYADGVMSVELFNHNRYRLYPLDNNLLEAEVQPDWIQRTIDAKGDLVWFGIDPADPNALLAIRLVTMVNQNFETGGYLLVRINREVFELRDSVLQGSHGMLLADNDGEIITSSVPGLTPDQAAELMRSRDKTADIGSRRYMVVRTTSEITGWTLLILTPISEITNGISVLRNVIVVSAGVGSLLYVIISLLLSTVIAKPIFKLIRSMRSTRLGVLKQVDNLSSTIEIRELNRTYNEMVDNINNLIRLVYEKEILQSRTELKALQAQINPHFLFNTLEALYRSLLEKNEEELAEFVLAMSELFRYTITNPKNDEWVALREEMDHIERYLRIMKTRLGDRLRWDISLPPFLSEYPIPKLIVQPLVENAITHGVERRIGTGNISVAVTLSENEEYLIISVQDDGRGMDEETLSKIQNALTSGNVPSAKGSGMGIANVERRIQLYYDERDPAVGIEISSREGEGTLVRIQLPYH